MQKVPPSIGVVAESPVLADRARQLADRLGLPFFVDRPGCCHLLLVLTGSLLQLEAPNSGMKPLRVNFSSKAIRWRLAKGGGQQQPIARAVGLKPGYRPTVLDATAGLGQDAFILASLGCRVLMIERSPVIGALLVDGLDRARRDARLSAIVERLSLRTGIDSITALREDLHGNPVDVVFLDPMYPDTGRTAKPKKEMFYLRSSVGEDLDAAALLAAALRRAVKRVVVKRPRLAPAIEGPTPSFSQEGKSSRFDIYLR